MTIADLRKKFSSIKDIEFELLIAFFLKKDRLWVISNLQYIVTGFLLQKIIVGLEKLTTGSPLAYIVGIKRFYELDFKVNKHVLIPRQETEELVQHVLDSLVSNKKHLKVADLGTGSGCIGVTLAKFVPQNQYYLVDKSTNALKVAQYNVNKNLSSVAAMQVSVHSGNLLEPLQNDLPDIIVANLPYLGDNVLQETPGSVKDYEPYLALYGGKDGLDLYRDLMDQIASYYKNTPLPEMWWEISPEQKELIESDQFPKFTYQCKFLTDLSNRFRIARWTC